MRRLNDMIKTEAQILTLTDAIPLVSRRIELFRKPVVTLLALF
jgi:hypothetical protein